MTYQVRVILHQPKAHGVAMSTCFPAACKEERDQSKPESIPMRDNNGIHKRHWLKRCCGERMYKNWIVNHWKCSVCGKSRMRYWGTEAVCSVCNRRECTGSPYD